MGFKALTINTVAEEAAHIYAQDDAAIYQSIFGIDGVFNIGNLFSSTVLSNNKVRLSDGVLNVGGHIGRIEYGDYEDVTIENGTSGYYRNDIIYGKFLTSGDTDSFSIAVKKGTATTGTASDPALTQGNVYQGDVERDYPLYRVKLSGLSITEVEALFDIVPTIPDLLEKCNDLEDANTALNSSLSDLNSNLSNNFAFNNIEKNSGSIDSGAVTAVTFGGVQIGKNNIGNFAVLIFTQNNNKGLGCAYFVHAYGEPSNSYAVEQIAGVNTARPTLKFTSGGNLVLQNNYTDTMTIRVIIFKL